MSSNLITQPYGIIIDPTGGGGKCKPVSNGLYHVGVIDMDPVQFPRDDIAYKDESGTVIDLNSPLQLNNSGAFVASKNDGTIIQPFLKNAVGYSVLITGPSGSVYSSKHVGDPGNISDELNKRAPIDSIQDRASLVGIVSNGQRVEWLGYYEKSDGGSNWGIVKQGSHTEDGGSIFSIDSNTYIEANLKPKKVDVRKWGAKVNDDTFDNSSIISALDDYAWLNGNELAFPAGFIYIGSKITKNRAAWRGVMKRSYGNEDFIGGENDQSRFPSATVIRALPSFAEDDWMIDVPDDQRQFRQSNLTYQGNRKCNGVKIGNRNRENDLDNIDIKFVKNGFETGDWWMTKMKLVTVQATECCFNFAGGGTTTHLDTCIGEGSKRESIRCDVVFKFSEDVFSGGSQTFTMTNCAGQYCVDQIQLQRDQKLSIESYNAEDWTGSIFAMKGGSYGVLNIDNLRFGGGDNQSVFSVDGNLTKWQINIDSIGMFTNSNMKLLEYKSGTLDSRTVFNFPESLYSFLLNDRGLTVDSQLISAVRLKKEIRPTDEPIIQLTGSTSYLISSSRLGYLLNANGVTGATDLLNFGNGGLFKVTTATAGANPCLGYFSVRFSSNVLTYQKVITGSMDVEVSLSGGLVKIDVPSSNNTVLLSLA